MRDVLWIGSSKRDLSAFPKDVKKVFGKALFDIQNGDTPAIARPLRQFGTGVLELRDEYQGNAYRSVYIVRLRKGVYVVHAFIKKSKSGKSIPRRDVATIENRLKQAVMTDED